MYQVVIADDEAIIRQGLKRIINWESLGFKIAGEAKTGDEALALMQGLSPDLILLDISMPGLAGLEALAQARAEGFDGKVIVLTGYSDFKHAQEAIRCGVQFYLTKPIDEDELSNALASIKESLDKTQAQTEHDAHYRKKAYNVLLRELLLGEITEYDLLPELTADTFQVVLYDRYHLDNTAKMYSLHELLRVANRNEENSDAISIDKNEVLVLKGDDEINRFNSFISRYEQPDRLQQNSPLDALFIAYGRPVVTPKDLSLSYSDALNLMERRFFTAPSQHTIGYDMALGADIALSGDVKHYSKLLLGHIQSFASKELTGAIGELSAELTASSMTPEAVRLFITDLYLQTKEALRQVYPDVSLPFLGNAELIKTIQSAIYLYEIINFIEDQFTQITSILSHLDRGKILDNILLYIEKNHSQNLTLDTIAPLFGYNSAYLGKIFSQHVGCNFNTYLDNVRIEHAKELLSSDKDLKVYTISEMVGYRSVDYFHIKFKKSTGLSPAEWRKGNI